MTSKFDRRAERKARDAKDKARSDGLVADDILKRRIGDLLMLS